MLWRRLAVTWPAPMPWKNAQEPLIGSEELSPARTSETAAEFAGSAGGPRFIVVPTAVWLAASLPVTVLPVNERTVTRIGQSRLSFSRFAKYC